MQIKVKGHEVVYRDEQGNLKEHFIVADNDKKVEKSNAKEFIEDASEIISARKKTKSIEVTPQQIEELLHPKGE